MKRFLRITLILTLCPFTYQAAIGSRYNQNPRPISDSQHPSVISEPKLNPSAVFDKVDVVLEKIDAVAKFIRDYNAIPKIGSALKFIMPRFKIGRKFLMYYDHVRAKNEGRFPSFQKPTKSMIMPPKQTRLEYVYIYPSQAALGISKAISAMKMLPGPGEARVPQALKRVTCYNCRTRKEQWKRYNYFQNRRKRWPKQFYNPKHIIPASNEDHLFDYVTVPVTVKPTTAITIKSFRDILPGPNQLPYYANMFLDVFDTHFETWNSKIKSVIQTIKQKWRKKQNKNKEVSESQSSSYSSSGSRSYSSSDSSSDYSSYSNESSRSDSNYSSSSEYYDDETDQSRSSQSGEEEPVKKPVENITNEDNDKENQYEYYSNSATEQDSSSRGTRDDRNRNNKKYYESSSYDMNSRQIPYPKRRFSNVNPPGNNDLGNSNKKVLIKG